MDPGSVEFHTEIIERSRQHLDSIANNHPDRVLLYRDLHDSLLKRAKLTSSKDDIDVLIDAIHEALDSVPENHPQYSYIFRNFAAALQLQEALEDVSTDRDGAWIETKSQNMATTSEHDYCRPPLLKLLQAQAVEIIARIESFQVLVDAIGSSKMNPRIRNLEKPLNFLLGQVEIIKEPNLVIHLLEKALQSIPNDSPQRAALLREFYRARFEKTLSTEDLNIAIATTRQAMMAIPEDILSQADLLDSLVDLHGRKYCRTDSEKDLHELIDVAMEATSLTPGVPSRQRRLEGARQLKIEKDNRKASHAGVEARRRNLNKLEEIAVAQQQLSFLRARSAKMEGTTEELTVTIQTLADELTEGVEDEFIRSSLFELLGMVLKTRFHEQKLRQDLDDAINVLKEAWKLTPDRASLQCGLGCAYHLLFKISESTVDLECAIDGYQRALNLTAEDDPDLPTYLNGLGAVLADKYGSLGPGRI